MPYLVFISSGKASNIKTFCINYDQCQLKPFSVEHADKIFARSRIVYGNSDVLQC